MERQQQLAPDLADFEAMAREAFETIPPALRAHAKDVAIQVLDFPDSDTERTMGLRSPFDLMGLYHGVSLDQKSVGASPQHVDLIFLYRRPILDFWCETGEDLYHLVRHILIHEIGHHFGFSDEDMERIESEG